MYKHTKSSIFHTQQSLLFTVWPRAKAFDFLTSSFRFQLFLYCIGILPDYYLCLLLSLPCPVSTAFDTQRISLLPPPIPTDPTAVPKESVEVEETVVIGLAELRFKCFPFHTKFHCNSINPSAYLNPLDPSRPSYPANINPQTHTHIHIFATT